jgi:hypothetical protein
MEIIISPENTFLLFQGMPLVIELGFQSLPISSTLNGRRFEGKRKLLAGHEFELMRRYIKVVISHRY